MAAEPCPIGAACAPGADLCASCDEPTPATLAARHYSAIRARAKADVARLIARRALGEPAPGTDSYKAAEAVYEQANTALTVAHRVEQLAKRALEAALYAEETNELTRKRTSAKSEEKAS